MAESTVLMLQADAVEFDETHGWNTNVVGFDSGVEQRSKLWSRKKVDIQMSFAQAFEAGQVDALVEFFDARRGRFESFSIPSWTNDGRVVGNYASGSQIGLNTLARFSTVASSSGNLMIVGKRTSSSPFTWVMESRRISSISGNTITMASALNTAFPDGSFVYVGRVVRFAEDKLVRQVHAGVVYVSPDIDFVGL